MRFASRAGTTLAFALVAALSCAATLTTSTSAMSESANIVTTPSGLKVQDTKVGTGASPTRGQT